MLKSLAVLGVLAVTTLGVSAPLAAQARSTVSSTELESAVLAAPAADRHAVQHFLQDERVTATASSMGIRTGDLLALVSTLDVATLSQLAERTRAVDLDLVGGDQKVVLGTTAILLIIIIIILLAK